MSFLFLKPLKGLLHLANEPIVFVLVVIVGRLRIRFEARKLRIDAVGAHPSKLAPVRHVLSAVVEAPAALDAV